MWTAFGYIALFVYWITSCDIAQWIRVRYTVVREPGSNPSSFSFLTELDL